MFCSPLCIKKSTKSHKLDDKEEHRPTELDSISKEPDVKALYKVINLKHNKDLVIECNKLLTLLEDQPGNYWKSIRVTEDIQVDCFGNPKSIATNPYEETNIDFEYLMELAQSLLHDYHFNTKPVYDLNDERNYIIEIHIANSETDIVDSGFAIHKDNDRYVYGNVHTLLVYIDVNCVGGELDIFDDFGKKIIKTIPVKCNFNGIRCILLDGKCYHRPRPLISGKRIMISFQFESSDEESSNDSD